MIADELIGRYVTWRTWCGPTTAKVTGRMSRMASDGYEEYTERLPAGAREATPEEVAEFERRRAGRVAPIAYE